MKLKRLPEDFRVEEQIALPATGGPFALYRLTKQSLGTLEAIGAICEKWRLPRQQVGFAGLKDKHARTIQYVTIQNGMKRGIAQTSFELEYLGQSARPIHASDITGNRFELVLRGLTSEDVEQASQRLPQIARDGTPNYFDSQRFGSLGVSGEFIAKPWCQGDYERAIWLALADDNVHDRPDDRREKEMLRFHWGDWRKCLNFLPDSAPREVVEHLARQSGDFRRGIALMPQHLRSLWLAAFQSYVWNAVLGQFVHQNCRPEQIRLQSIDRWNLPFFGELDNSQRSLFHNTNLPLPSARLHLADGPLKTLYDNVLSAEGIQLREMRVKYPRDSFFSKGNRAAICIPADLQYSPAPDELDLASQKLTLAFTLPRGAYATIVVKAIFPTTAIEATPDDEDSPD
jgi:tRNA pseudouridine13 synthase